MDGKEYTETRVLKFEWVLRGVGDLFETSKGEAKSKCIKSALFGGGRWQIIFYANSGTTNADGNGFISLYLAAEPIAQEKESTVLGPNKWVREGSYTFGFELRNLQRSVCFQTKEARNHSFSWKTVNWGWAQFARRDAIYYNASAVRVTDAFLIICTITEAPASPSPPSPVVRQLVPKELLSVMGSLLNDPVYSDVEFVLPRRHGNSSRNEVSKHRTIYASKKLLMRVGYFDAMFRSGFAEGASLYSASAGNSSSLNDSDSTMAPPATEPLPTTVDDDMDTASTMEAGSLPRFEDSDDEDDYFEIDSDDSDPECEDDVEQAIFSVPAAPARQTETDSNDVNVPEPQPLGEPAPREPLGDLMELEPVDGEEDERNVQRKLSHPSSPHSHTPSLQKDASVLEVPATETKVLQNPIPGPDKVRVVIKDTAYATYRAVLYYIYTDTISFAPLASSFPAFTISGAAPSSAEVTTVARKSGETSTRKEWLKTWEMANPGKPRPCSAKAVYRLADKLDLQDLKERAFQHIIRSLTVENVAYEVFSHFSAAFDDVRKVEISYFLEHWGEIRDSPMMRNVWQQIRMGRHPGFEEVWPLIATNLEYKSQDSPAGRDSEKA